jgi:hypothetical protein
VVALASSSLTSLAGCSGSGEWPTLADFPPEPRVSACVTPVDPLLGTVGGSATYGGTVIEQGFGDPPADCFRGAGVVGRALQPGAETDGAIWYRIALAADGELVVGLQIEDAKVPPLAAGDPATVTVTYETVPVPAAWLTLRGGPASEVQAWVSASGRLLTLDPKIEVVAGRLVGKEPVGCGATDLYDALVRFDSLRAIIPLRWVGTVGEMRVVNARYGVPNYPAPECPAPPGSVETFLVGATLVPPRH